MNARSTFLALAVIFISSLTIRADDTPVVEAQPVSAPDQPVLVVTDTESNYDERHIEDELLRGSKPAVRQRIHMEKEGCHKCECAKNE